MFDWACIRATTLDESTPPERNDPSGTSEIMRLETASRNKLSSSLIASSPVPSNGEDIPARTTSSSVQ